MAETSTPVSVVNTRKRQARSLHDPPAVTMLHPAHSVVRVVHRPSRWARMGGPASAAALALLLVLALALAAPWLGLPDPNRTLPELRLARPGTLGHWLGTDELGRDLLSRLVWGARLSLLASALASAIGLLLGMTLGLTAGYRAGTWLDEALMRLVDVLMAFPGFLLALVIIAALGPGLMPAILALAVGEVPLYARQVRAAVLNVRHQEYIEAATMVGAGDARIVLRHILPNILGPTVVCLSMELGWMLMAMAGLSFLGLGVQPPQADWGNLIARGRDYMLVASHLTLVPGLAIVATALAFHQVGEGLRRRLTE